MKRGIPRKVLAGLVALLLGVLVWFFSPPQKVADTAVSGMKFRSQVWSGTVRITGDVLFLPTRTLTIKPGTRVLFEKGNDLPNTPWTKFADAYIKDHDDPTGRGGYGKSHFDLYGKILARGLPERPIVFSSGQADPEYADWDQLVLASGSVLDYVEVAYAHNGVNINGRNIRVTNSAIHDSLWSCVDIFSFGTTLENNDIFHCWHQAIGIKTRSASLQINTIQNNSIHDAWLGLNCEGSATPVVTKNTFAGASVDQNCFAKDPGLRANNSIEERQADVPGGTYGGRLIYPAPAVNP